MIRTLSFNLISFRNEGRKIDASKAPIITPVAIFLQTITADFIGSLAVWGEHGVEVLQFINLLQEFIFKQDEFSLHI